MQNTEYPLFQKGVKFQKNKSGLNTFYGNSTKSQYESTTHQTFSKQSKSTNQWAMSNQKLPKIESVPVLIQELHSKNNLLKLKRDSIVSQLYESAEEFKSSRTLSPVITRRKRPMISVK